MGCGGSKAFEVELGACASPFTAEMCLSGSAPAATVTNLKSVFSMMTKTGTISDAETSTLQFTSKVISTFNKEGETIDADGKRIGVSKTKTLAMVPLKEQTRVLRPTPSYAGQPSNDFATDDKEKATALYEFAKVVCTQKMGAEGEYSLYTAAGEGTPILTGKRLAGMKQKYLVYDAAGTCVAKVKQTDGFGKELAFEIAAGVDVGAVLSLVSGLAPGGGGGANAGSGTGAFGG